jgi:hypothetical protein
MSTVWFYTKSVKKTIKPLAAMHFFCAACKLLTLAARKGAYVMRITLMTGLLGMIFPFALSAAPTMPPPYPQASLHAPSRFFPLVPRAPAMHALPHRAAAAAPEVLSMEDSPPDEASNLPVGMTREQAEQIISLFSTPN